MIKYSGLFPFKPCNHNIYLEIIIFPHLNNTHLQVTMSFNKKNTKKKHKKVKHPISWLVMMTSSNGNIFRVTGHLCGECEFPAQRPVTQSFDVFSLICAWINCWVNNREAGDFRRHRAHYGVTVLSLETATLHPFTVSPRNFTKSLDWNRATCCTSNPTRRK